MKHTTLVMAIAILVLPGAIWSQVTPVLAVHGIVQDSFGVPYGTAGDKLIVRNSITGVELVVDFSDDEPGMYDVLFIDLTGNRAAAVGDLIEFTLFDVSGTIINQLGDFPLSPGHVGDQIVRQDLTIPDCTLTDRSPEFPWDPGQVVNIFGSNFLPGAAVEVGGVMATTVLQPSSSEIQIIVPPLDDGIYSVRAAQTTGSICELPGGVVDDLTSPWGSLKALYR